MSIVTALFGLGLALTVPGSLGTFTGGIAFLVSMDEGPATRRRTGRFLAGALTLLCIGVFLIGLTHQEATE